MRPSLPGSGKFETPWARMRRENLSPCASIRCRWAWLGGGPPFGSRRLQSLWAAWNRELLTPRCSRATLGIAPLLSGSGNLGTACQRIHRAKATAPFRCAGGAVADEVLLGVVEPTSAT